MLEEVKKSLEASPIIKKGDYNYFVNPISDGVPAMEPKMLRELSLVVHKYADLKVDKIVAVEAMGIHLATALSLATDIPFVVIRKRQYGLEGETQVYQKMDTALQTSTLMTYIQVKEFCSSTML